MKFDYVFAPCTDNWELFLLKQQKTMIVGQLFSSPKGMANGPTLKAHVTQFYVNLSHCSNNKGIKWSIKHA